MLFWEAVFQNGDTLRLGQHTVPNISFVTGQPIAVDATVHWARESMALFTRNMRRRSSSLSKVPFDVCPIRFLLECPPKISHNFVLNSFCLVPVQLRLINCSASSPLTFDLTTLLPHESAETLPGRLAGSNDNTPSQYLWAGTTSHHVEQLAPHQRTTLPLTVCCFRSGIYNLNRFKITVKSSGGSSVDIYPPFQHLISVDDADSDLQQ